MQAQAAEYGRSFLKVKSAKEREEFVEMASVDDVMKTMGMEPTDFTELPSAGIVFEDDWSFNQVVEGFFEGSVNSDDCGSSTKPEEDSRAGPARQDHIFQKPVQYKCQFKPCQRVFFHQLLFRRHSMKHLNDKLKCKTCMWRSQSLTERLRCGHAVRKKILLIKSRKPSRKIKKYRSYVAQKK